MARKPNDLSSKRPKNGKASPNNFLSFGEVTKNLKLEILDI